MRVVGLHAPSDEVSAVRWRGGGWGGVLVLLLGMVGCATSKRDQHQATSSSSSFATSSSGVADATAPARVGDLLRIEDTRTVEAVTEEDLANADPRIRRAATRALARAEEGTCRDRLLATLADRDPEVLAWSAYGLGRLCAWDRKRTTRRLVLRAMSLDVEPTSPAGRLDPWFALARALGECASPEAEHTLVGWLSGPRGRGIAAAKGLGSVVTHNKRMGEETAAALLRAARGDAANDPLSEALYPFGRLKRAPARVENELLDVANGRTGHEGPARVFVFRALDTLGDGGVSLLGSILRSGVGYSAAERAEAARALGKIRSKASQKELLKSIAQLVPPNDPVALTSLVGPGFGPLLASIGAVRVSGKRRIRSPGIDALLALRPPPGAPAAVLRRVGLLRCAAARLTAGSRYDRPSLTSCDPQRGPVGSLARLAVIDRGNLEGARSKAWKRYLGKKHAPVVREAALRMISGHPEVDGAVALVANALQAEELGVVTEAATLLATHPRRFLAEASTKNEHNKPRAESRVSTALRAAIDRKLPADAIETRGALARACGALHMGSTRPWLETLCESPNPTLRRHAGKALSALDGKKRRCHPKPHMHYAPAPELGHLVTSGRKIVLETDVGLLTIILHPELAPVAATRFTDLVKKKFYDDMAVHRVVPGFVVQFGDRGGDGFGGAGDGFMPLRCETSPVPFDGGVVGIALGGRDTGSSQIFVTLGPAPHLDGAYAVIGAASGPWDTLTEGDRIRSARIAPEN